VNASSAQPIVTGDFRDKVRGVLRHRRILISVTLLMLAATVAMALLWPPTYVSGATILIEQQEIPQELVRSAVTSFADQRVQVISQRVMTTQNLLLLIERYNLYPDIRINKPREVLLQTMRDNIAMKMISADVIDPRSGRPTQATIAFSVSYKNRSPELALKVANDLTSLYLNENLTSRTRMAQQTSTFFTEEAARQQTRIVELDKKLSEFKEKNKDRLPELNQVNQQISERTDLDLRDAENRLAQLDAQKILLEAQLAQISPTSQIMSDSGQRILSTEDRLKTKRSELASFRARYAPGHPDILNAEREVAGLEKQVKSDDNTSDLLRRLTDAKQQLADAREKYAPDHPDVTRLTRIVAELEKAVAAAPSSNAQSQGKNHADNPAYVQVKGQLDALIGERESAVKRRDTLREKLDDYERRLAQEPIVERGYRELARELDSAQLKYQEIRSKQTEVQVSQNLESEQKGERFTMIEPPLPPEKPISPNRLLILVMGCMLSLGAAVGAAALRESSDTSVRGVKDLRALLSVPPLAAIPLIRTRAERRRHKRVVRYSWQGAVVAVVALVIVVHFLVRPLDVLWLGLLRRFGV
jgi:polysaccharide biosynthesis transport protein